MRYFNDTYANYYYVYDIESTKYEKNIETPVMGYSYLHGIKKYYFDVNMTKDNIEKYSDNYTPFRTNASMENEFIQINNEAVENDVKVIILVHNLTYEFYNAIFNMPTFNKLLQEDSKRVFAISSTKILNIKIGNLVFMDSLLLFGKSLLLCGNEVGMTKNEEHKTYNEIWTSESNLPEWEYSYNENDLDIVAVYFSKFLKVLNIDNLTDFIKTRVMTNTGMVKYVCKQINTKKALSIQQRITKETQVSITPEVQKWIENYVFRGGVCISVPCNTFVINNQVHSIDFASAYPAVMVTAVYPKGKLVRGNGSRVRELYNELTNDFDYKSLWKSERLYQPTKMFLFKCRLKNVSIRQFSNDNEIMYLSSSKCEGLYNGGLIVNGKVIECKELITSGTELDFILLSLFYTFDLDEVIEEYLPEKIGRLSEYKIKSISKFAVEKEGFKKLENACSNYETFINKCNEKLVNNLTYGNIFEETNETPTPNNMKHIKDICHSYLMNAKAKLNAQYGIGVQHQFQQEIVYNNYQFDIKEEETLNWNRNENYLQGIYITAHTRFRLLLMARHLIENNFNIVYFDTDSIKVMGDKEKLLNIVKDWNNKVKCLRTQLINIMYEDNLFLSNFGNFDYEGTYDHFITHGSKRYVSVTNGQVSCTISGVNKKANSSGATLFYKKYGLERLHYWWCGLNTLFDYPLCRRSVNFIPKEPMLIDDVVTDDNGKQCRIHQYSCEGISEKDCGYLLSSFYTVKDPLLRWYMYCKTQNGLFIDVCMKPHTIKLLNPVYDSDGYIIDGTIQVEKGYTIEKYSENLFKKWNKYFSKDKTMNYDDVIYKITHNFRNGVLIMNDTE